MKAFNVVAVTALIVAAAPAGAVPIVDQGVGVRMTENGLRFVESQADGKTLSIHKDNVNKMPMSCFDEIGINNLDATVAINQVALDWQGGSVDGLALTGYFDRIDLTGQIYGNDSDIFDLCPSFSLTLNQFTLENVVFTANLRPQVDGSYNLSVAIVQAPQIQFGNMIVDVNGFPSFLQDLIFSQDFVQNFIMAKLNTMLAEKAPDLVKQAVFSSMFTGYAGPFDYAIGASGISIDDNGADAVFDTQVGYSGAIPSCVPPAAEPGFMVVGPPALGEYGDDSMVELSVADAAVNQVLYAAWQSGLMCYDSDTKPLDAFTHVLEGLSPAAGALLKYDVVVQQPPEVHFSEGKGTADLNGLHLEAYEIDPNGGGQKLLLRADANLEIGLVLDVDRATNQLLVSLDGTSIQFQDLQSDVLYNPNSPNAEQDLEAFIQTWVVQRLNAQIQNQAVTPTIFPADQFILMLDAMHLRTGHLVAGATIYAANDPQVDKIAPDTQITSNPSTVERTQVSIGFDGSDDRAGTLLYSWQLDGGGWSPFKADTSVDLVALPDGPHTFEVKARDPWHNEDPTPATASFTVAAKDSAANGCGCDLSHDGRAPAPAVFALAGAVLLGLALRRRKAGA